MDNATKNLLDAFNKWLEETSKRSYVFTLENQLNLEQMIRTMNNQINMLIEFESKRGQ